MTTTDGTAFEAALVELEAAIVDVCYSSWVGNGPKRQKAAEARAAVVALVSDRARVERLEAVRHAQQSLINALAGGMNGSIVTERYERVWEACSALHALDGEPEDAGAGGME
jgi:hypothetical protein